MSRMNVNRKKFISQSMNNSKINDDTYSSELDIFKNYNNKKLNNRTVNSNSSYKQNKNQNNKMLYYQLLYNSPKYINMIKLKESIIRNSKSPSLKFNSPNQCRKNRSSSIDNLDNFFSKNNNEFKNCKKENKNNIVDKRKKNTINDNNNLIKKYNFNKEKLFKSPSKKNIFIKKINDNLSSFLSRSNNISYTNYSNFNSKFFTYLNAFDNYIKLISCKEEKDLLQKIKEGFKTVFNAYNKFNQKLILLNTQIKKDFQTLFKKKAKKKENSNKKISNNKTNESIQISNLKKSNSSIYSNQQLKNNSIFIKSKTMVNSKSNSNNNSINQSDDNINLTDLESITFCDKIKMKQINSYNHIPRLDLSLFNKKNTLYKSFLNKIKSKDIKKSK
jgi:hypothetical protein